MTKKNRLLNNLIELNLRKTKITKDKNSRTHEEKRTNKQKNKKSND